MVEQLLAWLHPLLAAHPYLAPALFIAVHVLLAVCLLPCSPMTLLAGVLWGGRLGFVLSLAGALASMAVTFALARGVLRDRIEGFLLRRYPRVAELLGKAVEHDWKLIAAVQLNPAVPGSSLGYPFGLTRIPFLRYLSLSFVFMLPLQLLLVQTGDSVVGAITATRSFRWLLASVSALIVLSLCGKRLAGKLTK